MSHDNTNYTDTCIASVSYHLLTFHGVADGTVPEARGRAHRRRRELADTQGVLHTTLEYIPLLPVESLEDPSIEGYWLDYIRW